jgi:monovalent cation:H+ antiporter-2, CPA2 family
MNHLPYIIQDLGIILITAALVSVVFKKLKQPVVLGYILAGFLVGPHFPLFPTIKDNSNISIWAEIGVIFMLFGLGLEFSFKKLGQVGKSAAITATFEILVMLAIGYGTGQALGWSMIDSLFLGGILSISSTTIIVRAFEELGLKRAQFVSLVFGVLIIEDLIAILLLVLLSSVAVTKSLSGVELAYSSLRLIFFLVLWFLMGIYILPVFLKKIKAHLSDETTLVVSIGLCLTMVIIASRVGFSPALGAFVMGSILAETREGHRIEKLILPVKDLFSAIFFVSVGMLLDFKVLIDYYDIIILISLVTVVGKLLSSTIGALVSGRSLKNSLQAGFSLAQIGEFSFIIATLGISLKVTSEFLYPIAVAVSAVTTLVTPYLIKASEAFYTKLDKKLPENVKVSLQRYEQTMQTSSSRSLFSLIWNEYGIKIGLNSVIIIAITLGISHWVLPRFSDLSSFVDILICLITLLLTGPFLWAIVIAGHNRSAEDEMSAQQIDQLNKLQIGVSITRFLIGLVLVGFVVSQFTSVLAISGLTMIGLAVISVFLFSRASEVLYSKIERRFLTNLSANEKAELAKRSQIPELAPWSAVLAEIIVSANSPYVAHSLKDSQIKEKYGVTVAMIERGTQKILAPKHTDLLLPFDKLYVIGTDEQILLLRERLEVASQTEVNSDLETYKLTSVVLSSQSVFVERSIRECGLREAVGGLIVGLERGGQRFLSPDSAMILKAGDLVGMVGHSQKINTISRYSV